MKQTNQSRNIFIGDIHGCYKEFIALLDKLNIQKNDIIYLTGDLILKGKKSIKVLKYCQKNNFLFVKGNKEHELLKSISSGEYYSKEEKKIGEKLKNQYPELLKYIKDAPYFIETEKFILVHAGILPDLDIAKQEPGELCYLREYKSKPWYEYYKGDKKIIYGHWSVNGLKIRKNTIGLDSGCVYGGKLTAYILETGEIFEQQAFKLHKNPFKKGSFQYYIKILIFLFTKNFSGK